jgi:putative aldouronate transport system permease protein
VKKRFQREWELHVLLVPALIITFIFSYLPIYGILMAFQDYNPGLGVSRSPWVGLETFRFIFSQSQFVNSVFNTFFISLLKIVFGVFASVTFALLLNEVGSSFFKRLFQTIVYVPNFISWIIMAGIMYNILASNGIVNLLITALGGEAVQFLSNPAVFRWTLILSDVWKTFGFGTVVYLAAITAIDPGLYESAIIDGAGRLRQTFAITLPFLGPTIVLMTTLALGNVLNAGFDQVFNLYSPGVYVTGDIIDTYVYRLGLLNGRFSIGTAVGLLKSVVSMVLISTSLYVADEVADCKVW